jgi:hypothetical protein
MPLLNDKFFIYKMQLLSHQNINFIDKYDKNEISLKFKV